MQVQLLRVTEDGFKIAERVAAAAVFSSALETRLWLMFRRLWLMLRYVSMFMLRSFQSVLYRALSLLSVSAVATFLLS